MFKRLILAVALCLAFAMPAAAVSGDVNGFYVGIKFIDSIQNKWGSGGLSGSTSQNTVGGGIYAGYDFYPQNNIPLRAEIEYALRSNMTDSEKWYYTGGSQEAKGTWGLQTVMANFYLDLHNSTAFTPYIGAGLGLGIVNTEYEYKAFGPGTYVDVNKSDTSSVFVWNVGAGVAYALNENISADLGYRYLGIGESEMKMLGQKYKTDGSAHEFSLGLRFTF